MEENEAAINEPKVKITSSPENKLDFGLPPLEIQGKALDFVKKLKKHYADQRPELEEIWKRCWNAFLCQRDTYYYEGRAKIYVPFLKLSVEVMIPRIVNPLYEAGTFFNAKTIPPAGTSPEAVKILEGKANDVRDYLKTQLDMRDFLYQYEMSQRQKAILGTTVVKTPFIRESKKIKRKIYDDNGLTRTVSVDAGYNGPDYQVLPIEDFYTDAKIEDLQKSLGCIHTIFLGWEQLKSNERRFVMVDGQAVQRGVYFNLRNDIRNDKKKSDSNEDLVKQEKYKALGISADISDIEDRDYQYDECHCLFDINSDGIREECIIGVLNEKYLIRLDENEFFRMERPFLSGVWQPVLGSFYGEGIINQGTLKLQYEANDVRNQGQDWRTMCLIPIVKYLSDGVNPADIKLSAGSKIPMETLGAIDFWSPPANVAQAADIAEEKLKIDIQDNTGAIRLLQGQPTGTSIEKTATGMIKGIQEANTRIKLIYNRTEKKEILDYLNRMYAYNEQFATKEFMVNMLESGKKGLNFEQLIGDYEFRIEGVVSMIENQEKVSKLKDILMILGKTMPMPLVIKILGKIWNLYGFKDWEEIEKELKPPEIAENLPPEVGENAPFTGSSATMAGTVSPQITETIGRLISGAR